LSKFWFEKFLFICLLTRSSSQRKVVSVVLNSYEANELIGKWDKKRVPHIMYNCTWPIETVEESNANLMISKLGGFHCLGKFKPSSLVMSTNKIFDSKLC
jgi:hypothetical protein